MCPIAQLSLFLFWGRIGLIDMSHAIDDSLLVMGVICQNGLDKNQINRNNSNLNERK